MKKKLGKILMAAGIVLVLSAVMLVAYNKTSDEKAGEQAKIIAEEIEKVIPQEPLGTLGEEINGEKLMPIMEIDGKDYIGIVKIPSLGLSLPVRSNWSYVNLRTSPCRYKGSAYDDSLIVAAHNYNSHFGLIGSLPQNSEVIFTDADGNVFNYTVASTEVIDKYDIDGMQAGDWDLTLFTCTVGGRERITLRCVKV